MVSLQTQYMGLNLKSPLIAGSCGLTADVEKMVAMEEAGVGAIVLKSIFEEQIQEESVDVFKAGLGDGSSFPGAMDYVRAYVRSHTIQEHVKLVRAAKSRLSIPVIASINCFNNGEWILFAKELESAGADALELNVFMLPRDEFIESSDLENLYFSILKDIKKEIKIPVCMKIGRYFTNMLAFVAKLKALGAGAVTIFNRFYEPDIDIETMTIGAAPVFSTPAELRTTLRWTGMLSGMNKQNQISASTGVHDGEAAVKLLLAGATTVQLCSVLYKKGISTISDINNYILYWMESKGFKSVDEFRGELSYSKVGDPTLYERAQFMKYFSEKR